MDDLLSPDTSSWAVWEGWGTFGDFFSWHLGQGPFHSFLSARNGASGLVEQTNPSRGLLSHAEVRSSCGQLWWSPVSPTLPSVLGICHCLSAGSYLHRSQQCGSAPQPFLVGHSKELGGSAAGDGGLCMGVADEMSHP